MSSWEGLRTRYFTLCDTSAAIPAAMSDFAQSLREGAIRAAQKLAVYMLRTNHERS